MPFAVRMCPSFKAKPPLAVRVEKRNAMLDPENEDNSALVGTSFFEWQFMYDKGGSEVNFGVLHDSGYSFGVFLLKPPMSHLKWFFDTAETPKEASSSARAPFGMGEYLKLCVGAVWAVHASCSLPVSGSKRPPCRGCVGVARVVFSLEWFFLRLASHP